jgi:regulator of protease activity HflC (stomatin/prohibitin superfamily)
LDRRRGAVPEPFMMLNLFIGAILLVLAMLALRYLAGVVTVFEHERGLRYQRGRCTSVLEAGTYLYFIPTTRIFKYDLRPQHVTVPGQEIVSSDGVSIKLSLAAQYTVADPLQAHLNSTAFQDALYLELQLALRDLVSAGKADALIGRREELAGELLSRAAGKAQSLGLNLQSVRIRDLTFSTELKRVFAQVVKAQKEAQAALERTRGETAALRNLANAARMLEQNPNLLQLRALQAVGQGNGNTIVLNLGGGAAMVPVGRGPVNGDAADESAPDGAP